MFCLHFNSLFLSLFPGILQQSHLVHVNTVVPLILRPPMGPRKSDLILQLVLNKGHLTQEIALWDQIKWSYNQGGS